MTWLEWPLRIIDRIAAFALGVMLVTITLVLFVNATARYFASFAIVGGEELARCLMVWMTFLGSYLLVRTQGHIAIDLFSNYLKETGRKALTIAVCILGIVMCLYFFKQGFDLTARIWSSGQRMSSLPLPRGLFYLAVPVGMGLMSVAFLQTLIATLTGIAQPKVADFTLKSVEAPEVASIDKGHA